HKADAVFRELLPQVSAFASYNKQYDPQPGIVDESETQTVGLKATLALYEGGATRSRIREAESTAIRRRYNIEESRRRIRQEVISHGGTLRPAREETASRKEQITASEGALAGVREEAKGGQRQVLDILDAGQEVIAAKAALAVARRNE